MASVCVKERSNIYNRIIYICVVLACMVPRYITALKIRVGIYLSLYTLFVILASVLCLRIVVIVKSLEFCFFWIWFAFIVLSVWRAEKIGVWAYYLDWILTALLFQQLVFQYKDENTYHYIVRAFTDALFIHLLIGLYEITAHTYVFEKVNVNISRRLYGHVAMSMFHNINDYATFLITLLPFAVYRLLNAKKAEERLFCVFVSVASVFLIVISESRAAILTLVALICMGFVVFAKKSKRSIIAAFALLAVFIIALLSNVCGIRDSVVNVINKNSIDPNGRSDIARVNLIKNGLYFLKMTYGFGVGAGNLYKWLGEKSIYYIGHLRFMHNWYVEVLVTFGVLFFILYLLFHSLLLFTLYSNRYRYSQLTNAFLISFVCFSIVSIASSSNVYSEWVWMYLVVVAQYSSMIREAG